MGHQRLEGCQNIFTLTSSILTGRGHKPDFIPLHWNKSINTTFFNVDKCSKLAKSVPQQRKKFPILMEICLKSANQSCKIYCIGSQKILIVPQRCQ